MKKVTVLATKRFTRDYLKQNSHLVFRNRELIIEEDASKNPEEGSVFRFKIGDGITPYKKLKYASTIYSLFPTVMLYDKEYETCIELKFQEDGK